MKIEKPDIEPDMGADNDGGERVAIFEPLVLSQSCSKRTALMDLAFDLGKQSAALRSSLPEGIVVALAELVRKMNCYYSNLIEGHNTHPVDIERALNDDYSQEKHKRDLQLEAKAHVLVQTWIDSGGLSNGVCRKSAILEIHRRFCENLPDDLLYVEDPTSKERIRVVPGQLRRRLVAVGNYVAVSPGAVTRFLERYEETYSGLGHSESVLATAAAHHRLLWIHPFLDWNGRVARLLSYAQLLEVLNTGGIWSIARGLARNESQYKQHLANCDQLRRHDWDGRGYLSEEALADFTEFFLSTCLDQVAFMRQLIQPERLRERILLWAHEEAGRGRLSAGAGAVLEAVLYRGELPRAEVARILAVSDRQARRVVAGLVEVGALGSSSDRAPWRIAFPAELASRWMPGLFPEK